MAGETERFIVSPQIVGEIPYHDMARAREDIGPSYNYMSNSMVPEADLWVTVREVKQVPADLKSFVEPHTHSVSKVYAIIGDLTVEVVLDGERHEVTGPAGVFIPAGMMHTNRLLSGSGYWIVIMRGGKYE